MSHLVYLIIVLVVIRFLRPTSGESRRALMSKRELFKLKGK
jgi:hypothetical protein